jgi:hypothetical protein
MPLFVVSRPFSGLFMIRFFLPGRTAFLTSDLLHGLKAQSLQGYNAKKYPRNILKIRFDYRQGTKKAFDPKNQPGKAEL